MPFWIGVLNQVLVFTKSFILCLFLLYYCFLSLFGVVGYNFFFYLQVKGLLTDFGDDMHCQFLEILRSLLDSYNSGSQVLQWYNCHIFKFLLLTSLIYCCFFLSWNLISFPLAFIGIDRFAFLSSYQPTVISSGILFQLLLNWVARVRKRTDITSSFFLSSCGCQCIVMCNWIYVHI